MNFNYTTLVFELLNFVVLMWLLERFLYKPVLKVINERRQSIEEKLDKSQTELAEAHRLKDQYETRLTEWEKEKAELISEFKSELKNERKIKLEKLKKELDEEREKQEATITLKHRLEQQKYKKSAHDLACRFIGKVFSRLSSKELEELIFHVFIKDLEQIDNQRRAQFLGNDIEPCDRVEVISAFSLPADLRNNLEASVNKAFDRSFAYNYDCEPGLIAGIKLNRGGNVLSLTLKDARSFFNEMEIESNGRQ